MTQRERRVAEDAKALRLTQGLLRGGVRRNVTTTLSVHLTAQVDSTGQTVYQVKAGEAKGRGESLAAATLAALDQVGCN